MYNDVLLPLIKKRVAAFDGERGCVFPGHHREIGLIELTVDGAESTMQCHVVRTDAGHWRMTRRSSSVVADSSTRSAQRRRR